MKNRGALLLLALALSIGGCVGTAYAQRFSPTRLLAILDSSGVQQLVRDGSVGIPVDITQQPNTVIVPGSVTCGTTATQLPSITAVEFLLQVPPGGARVHFADATVAATDSFTSASNGSTLTFKLSNTDVVFCRVASGTQVVSITVER